MNWINKFTNKDKAEQEVSITGSLSEILKDIDYFEKINIDGSLDSALNIALIQIKYDKLKHEYQKCVPSWEKDSLLDYALQDVLFGLETISKRNLLTLEEIQYSLIGLLQSKFLSEKNTYFLDPIYLNDIIEYYNSILSSLMNSKALSEKTLALLLVNSLDNKTEIINTKKSLERYENFIGVLKSEISTYKSQIEDSLIAIENCDDSITFTNEKENVSEDNIECNLEKFTFNEPVVIDSHSSKEVQEDIKTVHQVVVQNNIISVSKEEKCDIKDDVYASEKTPTNEPVRHERVVEKDNKVPYDIPIVEKKNDIKESFFKLKDVIWKKHCVEENEELFVDNGILGEKKSEIKHVSFEEYYPVPFANGFITFKNKKGLCYIGFINKVSKNTYMNDDFSLLELTLCKDNIFNLLCGNELTDFLYDDISKYYRFVNYLYEQYLNNSNCSLSLKSLLDFKKHYNSLTFGLLSNAEKEKEILYKAMKIASNVIDLTVLYGKSVFKTSNEMNELIQQYAIDIVENNGIKVIETLEQFSEFDFIEENIKDYTNRLIASIKTIKEDIAVSPVELNSNMEKQKSQNEDKTLPNYEPMEERNIKIRTIDFIPPTESENSNQYFIPDFRDIRFIIKKESSKGIKEISSYSLNNLGYAVEQYIFLEAYIKEIGILYNNEKIFVITYNATADKHEYKLNSTEKHLKHYDKGQMGEMVSYYENKLMTMINYYEKER